MKTLSEEISIDKWVEKLTTAAREPPAPRHHEASVISRGASLPETREKEPRKIGARNIRLINANTHTKPYTHPEELADKLNYTYNYSSTYIYYFSPTMAPSRF